MTSQKQGADACPKSRVPAKDIEGFVVERIKEIGTNPRLVAEAVKAARKQMREEKPVTERRIRSLERKYKKLSEERDNLIDAVAKGGKGAKAVSERLGKVDAAYGVASTELEKAQDALSALEASVITEDDLRDAIRSFTPVWDELFPKERSRIVHLLVEEVVFHAGDGELEITFRAGGVRALATEAEEVPA